MVGGFDRIAPHICRLFTIFRGVAFSQKDRWRSSFHGSPTSPPRWLKGQCPAPAWSSIPAYCVPLGNQRRVSQTLFPHSAEHNCRFGGPGNAQPLESMADAGVHRPHRNVRFLRDGLVRHPGRDERGDLALPCCLLNMRQRRGQPDAHLVQAGHRYNDHSRVPVKKSSPARSKTENQDVSLGASVISMTKSAETGAESSMEHRAKKNSSNIDTPGLSMPHNLIDSVDIRAVQELSIQAAKLSCCHAGRGCPFRLAQ